MEDGLAGAQLLEHRALGGAPAVVACQGGGGA